MPPSQSSSNRRVSCPTVDQYNSVITKINELVLFQKFQECLNECRKYCEVANKFPEDVNSMAARDSLAIFTIQALSELNRSDEVVPFITSLYSGLETCPPTVFKLLLQLYIKRNDLRTCNVLTNVWLKHPGCAVKEGYTDVIDLYIEQVLVPLKSWDVIRQVLNTCSDGSWAESRWRKVQAIKRQQQLDSADRIEVLESSSSDTNSTDRIVQSASGQTGSLLGVIGTYINKLNSVIRTTLSRPYALIIRNFCFACFLVYLLITRWRAGFLPDSVFGRFILLLQKLWRGMFAPFYQTSR